MAKSKKKLTTNAAVERLLGKKAANAHSTHRDQSVHAIVITGTTAS